MSVKNRIEINPRKCNGKPVITGTRIPVHVILEQIAAGKTWENILENYPEITKETLRLFSDKKSLTALLAGHERRDNGKTPMGKMPEKVFSDV